MNEVTRTQTDRFIVLLFIVLRYVVVISGWRLLTAIAQWSTAGDHVAYADTVWAWTIIFFYAVISAIFVIHVAVFIFWRDR